MKESTHSCLAFCSISTLPRTLLVILVSVSAALQSSELVGKESNQPLTLPQAIQKAIQQDPWQNGNELRRQSLLAKSESVENLPDPRISLDFVNVPSDGFSLSQEPMTQMKIGLSQSFPRGDTRAIQKKHYQQLSEQYPLLEQDRLAKITAGVSQLWFEAFYSQRSLQLILSERNLFEQLAETVESQYASGQPQTRQDDVIRSQVELSRLTDRQTQMSEQLAVAKAKLSEWIVPESALTDFTIPEENPAAMLKKSVPYSAQSLPDKKRAIALIANHPVVLATEQRIKAELVEVELTEQKYKPQWGVNASYAHRQDDAAGRSRADFFSIGLNLDVPLFSSANTDSEVKSQTLAAEALKTDKRLLMRQMISQLDGLRSTLEKTQQRIAIFEHSILPQLHEQAETSLTAYTNGENEFAEVMRARIAEFNGRMELINIHQQRDTALSKLIYFTLHDNTSATTGLVYE